MTKIKNTKKGMAKKTLSVSLAVAMLATSNVPVWAAEFSDGADAAFTAETPVVDTEEVVAPVAEAETPSVEDTADAPVAQAVNVSAAVSFSGADSNNTIDWTNDNSAQITANISSIKIDGKEAKDNIDVWSSKYILKYAWKVGETAEEQDDVDVDDDYSVDTYCPQAGDAGKKVSLILMVKDYDPINHIEGATVWSQEYGSITVNAKQISDYVEVSSAKIPTPVYNGEEQKVAVPLDLLVRKDNLTNTPLTDETKYKVTYTAKDFTNVTDEGITVTLEPQITGYVGSLTYNYKISPKKLGGSGNAAFNDHLVVSLSNPSYVYTGKTIDKIKASDITLIDKDTKEVLSNYLDVDKDGYVIVDSLGLKDVNDSGEIWVSLINGIPENGRKNYEIVPTDQIMRRVKTTNKLAVTVRDLSTVDVTIDPQSYTGKKVSIDSSSLHFTDKTTKEELVLGADVQVSVPDNAITSGKTYTATITAKEDNENVKGTATAEFSIYSANINNAWFEKVPASAVPDKDYTGEQITFTNKELGRLMILKGGSQVAEALEEGKDYVITFGANVNAGENAGQIIVEGRGSYLGSRKVLYFDIKEASLDSVKVNDYVEIINTQKASDYKDSMGLVVKAKNGSGKEFTLTEGTDYVVKYTFESEDAANNVVGKEVTADVTITNPNFKGNETTGSDSSEITAVALKDEYIKLKENSFTYTGKAIEPDFDVVIGGKIINPDLYTATYTNNLNAGTATLSITGKGENYSNKATAKVTFEIKPADASKLEGTLPSKSYKGYSIEVPVDEINVTLDGEKINVKDNFTVTYGENVNIGDGTVVLTPKNNNFTGTKTLTFKIVGELLKGGDLKFYDENKVLVENPEFDYDGTDHTFGKVVFDTTNTDYQKDDGSWADLTKKLTEGTDYEIKYVDNVSGKDHYGAVLVVAKGKYGGAYEGDFVEDGIYTDAEGNKTANVIYAEDFYIAPQTIYTSNITVSNGVYAGGLPVKPEVSITVNGVKLVEGKDYKVIISLKDYSSNDMDSLNSYEIDALILNTDIVNATAGKKLYAVIKGLNGYEVHRRVDPFKWGIDKFDLADADVAVQDGKVVVKCGKVDVESSEYTTTVNAEDGTTTITAVATSKNYTGSKTFSTNGKTDAEKPETPMLVNVNVVGNTATAVLSDECDGATGYDFVIGTSRDCITTKDYVKVNKNVLRTETPFTYVQQGTYYAYCHAWKRVNGVKVFSDWSNAYPFVVTAITPDQPVITSVKASGSTVTVTYTQAANATGYDVVLGSEVKKVNGESRPVNYGELVEKNIKGNTVTATFKNVPAGTYYAGLHAFNRTSEDGKKVFSPWSNTKKVTVK